MTETSATLSIAQELYEQSKSMAEIEQYLRDTGHPDDEVKGTMTLIKRLRHQALSKKGITLIGVGVALCLMGFAVLFSSSHEGPVFNFAMYGMTGGGSLSIIGGMALILG